jgi:hypothetical protein
MVRQSLGELIFGRFEAGRSLRVCMARIRFP